MKPAFKFKRAIVWFRRDLRLADHHALSAATRECEEVIPVFVIDPAILKSFASDNRQVSFIQDCIDELDEAFRAHASQLVVVSGKPKTVLLELVQKYKVDALYVNHDYEPAAKTRDAGVAKALEAKGVQFFSFKDQVIFERQEILNGSDEPYRVFTPYSKNWLRRLQSRRDEHLQEYQSDLKRLVPVTALKHRNETFWGLGFKKQKLFIPAGEKAAKKALSSFADSVQSYHLKRDFPAVDGTSILSPHFRFGTLSIREAVRFCFEHFSARADLSGAKTWLNELIWRDFYQMILDQYPHVVDHAFRPQYDSLDWSGESAHFKAWCEGKTGYPLVDAAMRQLNETGWMHNRLRMIAAMFLTKDLLVSWQKGEAYFAQQLLDFELASNNGGWQWSASTGCDAQPYFRVMNPITQSERFDVKGDFIRQWVPELKNVSDQNIHWPHDDGVLAKGAEKYVLPLVDHAEQRFKAIAMFKR